MSLTVLVIIYTWMFIIKIQGTVIFNSCFHFFYFIISINDTNCKMNREMNNMVKATHLVFWDFQKLFFKSGGGG